MKECELYLKSDPPGKNNVSKKLVVNRTLFSKWLTLLCFVTYCVAFISVFFCTLGCLYRTDNNSQTLIHLRNRLKLFLICIIENDDLLLYRLCLS